MNSHFLGHVTERSKFKCFQFSLLTSLLRKGQILIIKYPKLNLCECIFGKIQFTLPKSGAFEFVILYLFTNVEVSIC